MAEVVSADRICCTGCSRKGVKPLSFSCDSWRLQRLNGPFVSRWKFSFQVRLAGMWQEGGRGKEVLANGFCIFNPSRCQSGRLVPFFEKVALGGGLSEGFEKNLLAAIRLQGSGAQVSGTCVSHMSELINGTGNEKELKEKIIYLFNPRFKEKELIRKNSLVRFSAQGYCRELQ